MTEQPMSKIFTPRRAYKPFEYPEAMKFVELMQQSYWVHSEVNFDPDVQDFKSSLYPYEQEAIKRALLGIAQVEVSVKTFWGDLYDLFPKPEFNCLGMSFGESETRHSEAYSRLLEVLGYEQEFETLLNIPIFQRREEIIKHKLKATDNTLEKILFFTLIIENASLFSQFATILSMTKFKGKLKATANMIAWTGEEKEIQPLIIISLKIFLSSGLYSCLLALVQILSIASSTVSPCCKYPLDNICLLSSLYHQ